MAHEDLPAEAQIIALFHPLLPQPFSKVPQDVFARGIRRAIDRFPKVFDGVEQLGNTSRGADAVRPLPVGPKK